VPAVLAAIIWAPPWVYLGILGAVVVVAADELLRMGRCAGVRCGRWMPLLAVALVLAVAWLEGPGAAAIAVAVAVVLLPALHLAHRDAPDGGLTGVAVAVFTVSYLGLTGSCLGWLRVLPGEPVVGVKLVILVLVTIWIGDSGAYYVGRSVGRHRMSPRVSPKKTYEGLAGGVLGSFAAVFAFDAFVGLPYAWPHLAGLATVLAIAAPVGDLVISMFKRDCGVKDSSNLIPGHGGLLDRTDSLLFGSALVLAYLSAFGLLA
jgi:phosphatidate cytidylyltransferase